MRTLFSVLIAAALAAGAAGSAAASQTTPAGQATPAVQAPAPPAPQPATPPNPTTVCGQPLPAPSKLPPVGSGPVIYQVVPCFAKQGGTSVIEPETYLYYIQLRGSRPSQDVWVPYDDQAEKTILEDFRRLWATNFLDDLSIDVEDYRFANDVIGKLVIYDMEERQRVKLVDYVGIKHVEQSKIDDKLKEVNAQIRLDSFIDPGLVRKVSGIVKDMLAEKGYQDAKVAPEIKGLPGGPKLVHLTFDVDEGPRFKIQDIEFIGNKAVSGRALRRQMKSNKEQWFLSFITSRGTYQESKFAEDADKMVEYYRDKGYIAARVGEPDLKVVGDSPDRKTRWVELRIPVQEGERYRVGTFGFEGNSVVKSEALRPLFKVKPGDFYSDKSIRKGLDKARELYGTGGYFEFTGYPDLKPREDPAAATGAAGDGGKPAAAAPARKGGNPIVDVTVRLQEGKQYFISRITFVGNTTTRDNVVRRELRLYEGGVFNTEALKYSIKRINQLAYFKPIEGGKDIDVQKTPATDNKVDVTLKFEEQNRNQITFGAGVSQFEGFFGQLGFQTANFMGRGETFTISLQAGSRAQNYQVAFTEPYLFDRAITGGVNLFKRELRYIGAFTQASTGGNIVFGFPLADFTRMFLSYSYETVRVSDINSQYTNPALLAQDPYLADSLLIGQNGSRSVSKISPSIVHNTVDNPLFPTTGRRYTASIDLAGLGGNTDFFKPMVEGVWYLQHTKRTSIGLRAQVEYISPFSGNAAELPIFEKLFLGGEYSVRGYDIRSIGPKAPNSWLVVGGNKSLLFNAEYLISIAGPVRLVLFFDAAQVRDVGQAFAWKEPITTVVYPGALTALAGDPYAVVSSIVNSVSGQTVTAGRASAFKTSTGAEVRFFMPVLNVPFRLIFAYNPNREGIYNNDGTLAKAFSFRFAVGSTF
jgi:outer membrane protein insertion porin family